MAGLRKCTWQRSLIKQRLPSRITQIFWNDQQTKQIQTGSRHMLLYESNLLKCRSSPISSSKQSKMNFIITEQQKSLLEIMFLSPDAARKIHEQNKIKLSDLNFADRILSCCKWRAKLCLWWELETRVVFVPEGLAFQDMPEVFAHEPCCAKVAAGSLPTNGYSLLMGWWKCIICMPVLQRFTPMTKEKNTVMIVQLLLPVMIFSQNLSCFQFRLVD